MSLEHYRLLIDQFCEATSIPNSASLYESANFAVSGVDFSLIYRDLQPHGQVQFYADMGKLPEQRREAVLLTLLDINFHTFAGADSPVLAYNRETQRILLMGALPIESASPQHLLSMMSSWAQVAHTWRENFFQEAVPKVKTAAPEGKNNFSRARHSS